MGIDIADRGVERQELNWLGYQFNLKALDPRIADICNRGGSARRG